MLFAVHRSTWALVAMVVLGGMLGCQATCQHHPHGCIHDKSQEMATVKTGGLYASLKTLSIPEDGLSLGKAVELSLRPGISRVNQTAFQLASTNAAAQQTSEKVDPTIQAKELVLKAIKRHEQVETQGVPAVNRVTIFRALASDVQSGDEIVGGEPWFQRTMAEIFLSEVGKRILAEGIQAGKLSEEQAELAELADKLAKLDGAAGDVQVDEDVVDFIKKLRSTEIPSSASRDLVEALAEKKIVGIAINALLTHRDDLLTDGDSDTLSDSEMKLASIVAMLVAETGADDTAARASSRSPSKPSVTTVNPPKTSSVLSPTSEMVVKIKREGRKSIIVPLPLVMASPVGDVLLEDGDEIEVTSFSQTKLANRVVQKGDYAVAGLGAAEVAKTPARTLTALSTKALASQQGRGTNLIALDPADSNEQYWIPAAGGVFDGMGSPMMAESKVSAGDTVRISAVQLLPEVQATRVRSRVEEEIKNCLHEELPTAIQKAPVSQSIYNSMRQTLRRVGVPVR